jgi:hypothetical protein
MTRYVARDWSNNIVSSYEQPQAYIRLHQIDDQSDEYKEWEKSLKNPKATSLKNTESSNAK